MATIEYETEKVQKNTMHYFVGMRKPSKDADDKLFCIGKAFSKIDDNTPVKGFWASKEALKANNGALARLIVAECNKVLNTE